MPKSSLAESTGIALDAGAAPLLIRGFQRVKGDGVSLRRWFLRDATTQCEVNAYRDKRWTKSGGLVMGESYVLCDAYQRALGDGPQDWLAPDFARPLRHFQHGLSADARRFELSIGAGSSRDGIARAFEDWLVQSALPWIDRLDNDQGVLDYLAAQQAFDAEAEFAMKLGVRARAASALRSFLATLPRNAEPRLQRLRAVGLLSDADFAELSFASMQREDDYREAIATWQSKAGTT